MEFLDANLTKDSSLLLHAIHSPFYWRIFKRKPRKPNQTLLCLKKPVLRIRLRIHMFLSLPDPDPLVRGMDPAPAPDPSIIMQK